MAMQRVVGGVEVEHELARHGPVRLEEQVDQQSLDGRPVVADLVVARRSRRRVLEPVQGALAGERRSAFAPRLELAGERRQHRVVA
jgi:hypothetical protein